MPTTPVFKPAAGQRIADIRAALSGQSDWQTGGVTRLRRILLDTFDWRAYRAGGLVEVRAGDHRTEIGWFDLDEGRLTLRTAAAGLPRFAADLPPGPLHERVAGRLDLRALLAVAELSVRRDEYRCVDANDKTTARIHIDHTRVVTEDGTADLGWQLRVVPLRGYERAAAQATRLLRELGCVEAQSDVEMRAIATSGRRPGSYSSRGCVDLAPDEPAASAFRRVLASLLDTIVANVDGTIGEVDTEFLHDLRVAVRKSRSVLGRAHDVLPEEVLAGRGSDLRWLQTATGPARDLDVWILHWDELVADARVADEVLDPLLGLLRARHRDAHRCLNQALRSERFERFTTQWRTWLGDTGEPHPTAELALADAPIGVVAADLVRHAVRSTLKLGRRIDEQSPNTALHDLRKRAKRLRYLLECFAPVLPDDADVLVRELRKLQDVLGTFQDCEVQATMLRELADELGAGSAPAATLVAIGTLVARLDDRHDAVRGQFASQFVRFERSATAHRIRT